MRDGDGQVEDEPTKSTRLAGARLEFYFIFRGQQNSICRAIFYPWETTP